MPTVTVDELCVYYEWHGSDDSPPLVLICGLGLDISVIASLIDDLAARYRVLAFDNRGAGRTDKPDAPYSVERMAADTAGLMRAVGLSHAAVLGISLGGRIALALALAEPDLVDRLILASSGARVVRSLRRWVKMLLAPALPVSGGPYPQPSYAFRRQVAASTAYDASGRLGEIGVPALILHGIDDRSMPVGLAEELHAGLAGSILRTFPGGHGFLLRDGRRQFLDALFAWY
ncbi:alpha/beta hydrolase [Rugosimonospora acidiphila]|uniref:Alpha/beta hydrolase n=1 Tax=Rugosimonospora acidiphila TaxID=556531 RepID=A0ABP9S3U9_9ACTN